MGGSGDAGAMEGRFVWPEANVRDTEAAKAFYTSLFGWGVRQEPNGGYAEWQQGGKSLGGLIALADRGQAGVPPHWMGYVAVADCDAVAARVRERGGRVLHGPFSLEHVGRFAAIEDPTGAHFCLYQASRPGEAPVLGVPGAMCWNELMTRDTGAAKAFYTSVFGWDAQTMPMDVPDGAYTVFVHGGAMVAGMMSLNAPQFEGVPPHWMIYFAVEDCDATAARAAELGGTVVVPPMDIPNIGRFSVVQDPQGATFSIIRLAGGPPA